jgi:hypothetical protein
MIAHSLSVSHPVNVKTQEKDIFACDLCMYGSQIKLIQI